MSTAPAGQPGPVNGQEPAKTAPHNGYNPIEASRPHPARRYDALLGGKDNFAADRESADRLAEAFPSIRMAAIENRRFLRRVTSFLAAEAGIRQFLDIGTGIPTIRNVHEIAQAVASQARVVYVDNDPLVIAHARALMNSTPDGATASMQADLRDPDTILSHPVLRAALDFHKPIGLLLIAVLHFLDDPDEPHASLARLVEALPSGSYLAVSHATFDPLRPDVVEKLTALADPSAGQGTFRARTRDEVARFLDGLKLVDPGLVSIVDWRPEHEPKPTTAAQDIAMYGAVACLP
jgi:hypothetical protein